MQWLTRSDLDGLHKKPRSLLEEAIADAALDVPEVTQVGRETPAGRLPWLCTAHREQR